MKNTCLRRNSASWWSSCSRREHVSFRVSNRAFCSLSMPSSKRGVPSRLRRFCALGLKPGNWSRNEEEIISLRIESVPRTESSHFLTLIRRPRESCSDRIELKSALTFSGPQARVPSSIYHTLSSEDSRDTRLWMHKEKQRGPKGSPCWIPSADGKVRLLKNKKLESE